MSTERGSTGPPRAAIVSVTLALTWFDFDERLYEEIHEQQLDAALWTSDTKRRTGPCTYSAPPLRGAAFGLCSWPTLSDEEPQCPYQGPGNGNQSDGPEPQLAEAPARAPAPPPIAFTKVGLAEGRRSRGCWVPPARERGRHLQREPNHWSTSGACAWPCALAEFSGWPCLCSCACIFKTPTNHCALVNRKPPRGFR